MQLWEGPARPESGCPSGVHAGSSEHATLHVMPRPGPEAPSRANGYRFDGEKFAVFTGRLFEQNLNVTGVKLPPRLEGGKTIQVPVDVRDLDGRAVYDGRLPVLVCDLSK